MKKFNLTVFVLMFSVALFGCSDDKNKTETTETQTQEEMTEKTNGEKTSATETTEEKTESAGDTEKKGDSDGNIVIMETSLGKIKIKLYTEEAPITTGNFKDLINAGFYDGIIFHRVIDGFMIQGGDPTGTGRGGSDNVIKDEFHPALKHNKPGILSMANKGPNTGTSQFFITLAPQPHLDNKHAIFGEVIEGMDVVQKIGKVTTGPGDKPVEDVVMTKVTVESN